MVMKYKNIVTAKFIERPNRFIAKVDIDGEVHTVHVKNTGRCREILVPGTTIFLETSDNPDRKTKYDLVSAVKGERIINIDSQLPNHLVEEWLENQDIFRNITYVKREKTYGKSRFDFYIEADNKKIFIEVKGVTLENDNVVSFPDAPTERGIKHLNELLEAVKEGYEAYVFFVVQLKDVRYFTPADDKHKEFADTLRYVASKGVNVIAYDCSVTANEIIICDKVLVKL